MNCRRNGPHRPRGYRRHRNRLPAQTQAQALEHQAHRVPEEEGENAALGEAGDGERWAVSGVEQGPVRSQISVSGG